MIKNIKLTAKTAKALIKQELNLSATGLVCTSNIDGMIIYELSQGNITIKVENDWQHHDGMIHMVIAYGFGSSLNRIDRCFHPVSLEMNAHATSCYLEERERDIVFEASIEADKQVEHWRKEDDDYE